MSVATWVFNHVLRVTRPHLSEADSSKILELIDEAETGLNYISLEKLTLADIKVFREALEQGYQEMLAHGARSFGEPKFYPYLWSKEWDETGDPVKDYVLPTAYPQYKFLEQMRERERTKTK